MNIADAHRRQRVDEADMAAALLGADHALVRTLRQRATVSEQGVVVTGVLIVAATCVLLGASAALPVLIAGAVVAAGLACMRYVLGTTLRERAIDLIVDGRGDMPLRAVEQQRGRLGAREHRRHLAAWLEGIRRQAENSHCPIGPARPLFNTRVIRAVGPDLTEIAARLRDADAGTRGVAMVERLLCAGVSPLYGSDPDALRSELRRIRLTLGR